MICAFFYCDMLREIDQKIVEKQTGIKKICPKCGWKTEDYGYGSGLTANLEELKGDWCLRCWIKETTKNVPLLVLVEEPKIKT